MSTELVDDLRTLIQQARDQVAQAVNTSLVALYWQMGRRIQKEILKQKRAAYGEEVISTLSKQLRQEFGQGFSKPNLSRILRFAEAFPDFEIVSTLSKQLSWSHFVEIIPLDDGLKRNFYAELCRVER